MADQEVVVEEGKPEEPKVEVKLSPDEEKAVSLGWKPKTEWDGPEDGWVPAKWWLKYGDTEQRVIALEAEQKHKEKVIAAMKGHYLRVKEDTKKELLDTIKRHKAIAIKNEDYQKVAELDLQANDLEANLDNSFKKVDAEVAKTDQPTGPSPEFYQWNRENTWYKYGNKSDEMTVEADTLAVGYAQRNPGADYKDVLRYVEDKIKKIFPDKFKPANEPITAVDEGGTHIEPTRPRKGTIKLDAAQKAAAAAFNMSEEEYAKGLQEYEARKGR